MKEPLLFKCGSLTAHTKTLEEQMKKNTVCMYSKCLSAISHILFEMVNRIAVYVRFQAYAKTKFIKRKEYLNKP